MFALALVPRLSQVPEAVTELEASLYSWEAVVQALRGVFASGIVVQVVLDQVEPMVD